MRLFIVIIIAAFVAVGLLMLGLGIKVVTRRNGEFKRHCASRDPYTGESGGCVCANGTACGKKTRYNPLDVNENTMKEISGQ
ncbi:MAG: hypothetical protein K5867_03050 [Bacteroidales bacterium]|jgi:hypothetical protein|nr:hypothetical protein [Bacteroidales bacterium]